MFLKVSNQPKRDDTLHVYFDIDTLAFPFCISSQLLYKRSWHALLTTFYLAHMYDIIANVMRFSILRYSIAILWESFEVSLFLFQYAFVRHGERTGRSTATLLPRYSYESQILKAKNGFANYKQTNFSLRY